MASHASRERHGCSALILGERSAVRVENDRERRCCALDEVLWVALQLAWTVLPVDEDDKVDADE